MRALILGHFSTIGDADSLAYVTEMLREEGVAYEWRSTRAGRPTANSGGLGSPVEVASVIERMEVLLTNRPA